MVWNSFKKLLSLFRDIFTFDRNFLFFKGIIPIYIFIILINEFFFRFFFLDTSMLTIQQRTIFIFMGFLIHLMVGFIYFTEYKNNKKKKSYIPKFIEIVKNKSKIVKISYDRIIINFILYFLITVIFFIFLENLYLVNFQNFFVVLFMILIVLLRFYFIYSLAKGFSISSDGKKNSISIVSPFVLADILFFLFFLFFVGNIDETLNKFSESIFTLMGLIPSLLIDDLYFFLILGLLLLYLWIKYNNNRFNPFLNHRSSIKPVSIIGVIFFLILVAILKYLIFALIVGTSVKLRFSGFLFATILIEFFVLLMLLANLFSFFRDIITEETYFSEGSNKHYRIFEGEVIGYGKYEYLDSSFMGFKLPESVDYYLVKCDKGINKVIYPYFSSILSEKDNFKVGDKVRLYSEEFFFDDLGKFENINFSQPIFYQIIKDDKS